MTRPKFKSSEPIDFLVIGAGASGGVVAKELATGGFNVVVLEQGPYLRASTAQNRPILSECRKISCRRT